MTQKGEIRTILLIVLIALSLILAAGGFFLFQKEHKRNLDLQEQLDEISARQKIAEKNLEESKGTIVSLGHKLDTAQSQIASLNNELQVEKSSKQEALAKIEQLKTDVEQQKQLRADLEKKFNQAALDLERIQTQVKELGTKKTELETKIKELEAQTQAQAVELGKIVVSPPEVINKGKKPVLPAPMVVPIQEAPAVSVVSAAPAAPTPVGVEGKVLVVNKDYDFVVINVGSKDDVQIGNIFAAYHSNNYIGDIKIEKVHDTMAAAGFMTDDIKNKINEGDRVVRKVK